MVEFCITKSISSELLSDFFFLYWNTDKVYIIDLIPSLSGELPPKRWEKSDCNCLKALPYYSKSKAFMHNCASYFGWLMGNTMWLRSYIHLISLPCKCAEGKLHCLLQFLLSGFVPQFLQISSALTEHHEEIHLYSLLKKISETFQEFHSWRAAQSIKPEGIYMTLFLWEGSTLKSGIMNMYL